MVITDLPVETLEHIVAALDLPTDLRNLAAVCTQLRSIVEPYHTQFRVIRAPIISPLWKKFAENQLLAQNVRILEVQSAESHGYHEDAKVDDQVIPAIFGDLEVPSIPELDDDDDDNVEALMAYDAAKNDMDLDSERILVSALKGMSNLTSFQWTRTPPLINRIREDDIWITLAKYCPSLNVIDVVDREKPYEPVLQDTDDPAYQRPSFNPNFYLFKDLKSFSFRTEAFNVGNFTRPDVERCGTMLIERCPNLEVLKLQYILYANPNTNTVSVSPLLSGAPWNSLRELTLSGFNFVSTKLSSHLASHPTIEVLSLTGMLAQSLVLPPDTLPRLKHLSTTLGSMVTNSILDSTIVTPRPLECIMGPLLNDVFLDSLEQCGSGHNLKKLVTSSTHNPSRYFGRLIRRLSVIAPNLEWLGIKVSGQIDHTLYPVFGRFPHLRTIQGVKFISSTCEPASENTEVIRTLATVCPDLRRIDGYMGTQLDGNLTVIIERNGSHGTWSLRRIVRGIEGSVFMRWGERGHGSFEL
ncbi:hypothetical protein BYT27DRAFT_7257988 [Phlegmacium glaucopus]|nr:hypothetical protein BYT27DRAFT_7257988 [Phlegmacium glaucopus]